MTGTDAPPKTDVRSWSQLEQYRACPYQYYLARIEKVWQRPAAWFPMGSAVHAAAEAWERAGRTEEADDLAISTYHESYDAETNEYLEDTPNTRWWEWSGPYDGEADILRREPIGEDHVRRYIAWYRRHPAQVPIVLEDGSLAVELPFEVEIGGVPVRGYLDYLGVIEDLGLIGPRDNKTGNKPGKALQLRTYAEAAKEILPDSGPMLYGDFMMTKTGKPTVLQNLCQWSYDEFAAMWQGLDSGVKAGDFPATPGAACARCSVRDSCEYQE